jgi:hypothetical protein
MRPPTSWPMAVERGPQQIAESVARTVRELLPFPSADLSAGLPLMGGSPAAAPTLGDPASAAASAADIVSKAAGILDEEMARGVLSAREIAPQRAYGAGVGGVDPSAGLMKQLHDVIDNVARMWPSPDRASAGVTPMPAPRATPASAVVELRPATVLRPGARSTISMTLRNGETRPVNLTPAVTPLLGSNGERIPSQLVEFSPPQITLEPGGSQTLQITVTAPAICKAGRYSGILVVSGVDDARALVTVDVAE